MKRRTIQRLLCGAGVAGLTLVSTANVAQAGEVAIGEPSHFAITAYGADAQTVLDGLTLEIFEGSVAPGASGTDITALAGCVPDGRPAGRSPALAGRGETCDLDADFDGEEYTIGVAGVPAGYEAVGLCSVYGNIDEAIPGGNTTFTLYADEFGSEYAVCDIFVGPADATMLYSISTGGLGHETAMTGVDIEVYSDGTLVDPLDCTSSGPDTYAPMFGPVSTTTAGSCNLPPVGINDNLIEAVSGYELGITPLPEGYSVEYAECYPFYFGPGERFTDPTVGFDIYLDEMGLPSTLCEIYLDGPPTVYVEHVVEGDGPAATTDFTTQLFAGTGALAGESSDPSPDFCMQGGYGDAINRLVEVLPIGTESIADVCGAIVLPASVYSVGVALPDYGYEATADCTGEPPFGGKPVERIVSDLTEVEHPTSEAGSSLCVVTATYYTQTISVDVVTDNSAGGDSDGSDITIEVYDQDGVEVDSGVDPLPNDPSQSAEFELPIGDYTIGASGPDGYLFSVNVTVVDNDVTDSTLPPEIIDDGSADLSLTSAQTASAELLATGQPAPTTTTPTTTTTTTTTTLAPTTTAIDAGGVTLPATGGSSTTTSLAWWALGLLAAGVLIARLSRRPANSAS